MSKKMKKTIFSIGIDIGKNKNIMAEDHGISYQRHKDFPNIKTEAIIISNSHCVATSVNEPVAVREAVIKHDKKEIEDLPKSEACLAYNTLKLSTAPPTYLNEPLVFYDNNQFKATSVTEIMEVKAMAMPTHLTEIHKTPTFLIDQGGHFFLNVPEETNNLVSKNAQNEIAQYYLAWDERRKELQKIKIEATVAIVLWLMNQ